MCFVLGSGVQWLAFEKELWYWDFRTEQAQLRVRIDRLEAQDLDSLLKTLEKYGNEIDEALLFLGYRRPEGGDE